MPRFTDTGKHETASPAPVPATISAVVQDSACLLVRRANPPDAGRWGFPGGKIETGESIRDAAVRELHEETGLMARAGRVFTGVDVLDHDPEGTLRQHFVLIGVLCHGAQGTLNAGGDALEARWFDLDELETATLATSFGVADVARLALQLSPTQKE